MRLIIDTDAGVDDAHALMLALDTPGVTVEAITTLTGNTHIDWVTENVFATLDLMGASAPVYRGTAQPLLPGFWEPEMAFHGEDGLGNYERRPASHPPLEAEPAAVALTRMASEAPGELTLVALGPLTNIALACRLDPEFPAKIKQFVFMGGTISALGNTDHVTAEFNMHIDPEAALIVLDAFPVSTMLSWETTLKHPFAWDAYAALCAIPTARARFYGDIARIGVGFLKSYDRYDGFLLPDPLAMAVALNPDLVRVSQQRHVTVETHGRFTRGQTVIDYHALRGGRPNVRIVTDLDCDGVYAMFERVLRAGA